jgi:hypothetical protein
VPNYILVPYGIFDDKADMRFHVSVVTRTVFVFEPVNALAAIEARSYPLVFAKTKDETGEDIVTGQGYLIPPGDINGCRSVPIPFHLFDQIGFDSQDGSTAKGAKAERLVLWMIDAGFISTVIRKVAVTERELQVSGADVIMARVLQIKLDWKAGSRQLGGSGHLFIQTAECNPQQQY